jgi:ABC-type polar amino acid transport system ATPase subunit
VCVLEGSRDGTVLCVAGLGRFVNSRPIVQDVALELHEGEVLCILGRSGAGKTTLLRCLANLDEWVADRFTFRGQSVEWNDINYHRRIGFVFQDYSLWPHRTVIGNVMEGLLVVRHMGMRDARKLAEAALEKVGMCRFADRKPDDLSGGEKQRVALARALVTDPEILFLDEITSALDPENATRVLDQLSSLLSERRTCVLVSHELGFVRSVAQRVCFIDAGRVVELSNAEAFFSGPREPSAVAYLKAMHGITLHRDQAEHQRT